jgi:hypothetical protein
VASGAGSKSSTIVFALAVMAIGAAFVLGYSEYQQIDTEELIRRAERAVRSVSKRSTSPSAPPASPPSPSSRAASSKARSAASASRSPVESRSPAAIVVAPERLSEPTQLEIADAADAIPLAPDSSAPPEALYGLDDVDVAPPTPLRSGLGTQRLAESPDLVLELQLIVDRLGNVESVYVVPNAAATLSDAMLATFALHAIREWKFSPALRYGAPVRYRHSVWLNGEGKPVSRPR